MLRKLLPTCFCLAVVVVNGASLAEEPKAEKPAVVWKPLFDGKTLKGVKTAEAFVFKKHGKVEVADGAIQIGRGDPGSGVVFEAEMPKVDYEVRLEAQRVKGDDFFCGLTFPVEKDFCTLIIGGWGGGVIGLSNVDGNSAVENETTKYLDFKNGKWHAIRLRVTRHQILAWIDEKPTVELATKGRKLGIWWEQEPMRPLGVATWDTAAALRKVEWRKITEAEAAPQATNP